jgi:MoxR-like ATPase
MIPPAGDAKKGSGSSTAGSTGVAGPAALVGRESELEQLSACISAGRNVLLEGPVGVGKTHLALAVTRSLGRPIFRVDGDSRYTEQKLTGWFDPPTVLAKGYTAEAFVPGPLIEAMRSGGVLFVNELNRLPEGVQNVLLPAIDERLVQVPRLGEVRAAPGFVVVATQNPKEFVATSHLSEAVLDRFELVTVDYQAEEEELRIVQERLVASGGPGVAGVVEPEELRRLAVAAVRLARLTRSHPRVRRGASVRAALAVGEIGAVLLGQKKSFAQAFELAALLALPTRIEIESETEAGSEASRELQGLVRDWVRSVLEGMGAAQDLKKKS